MNGLILAAGRGSRLLPVSATRPKHAVPVAGVPIIARAVDALRRAGVDRIGVVVSPASEQDLRDATQHLGPLHFIRQREALGTGHAVLAARDFLQDDATLLYLGDNLFQDALTPLRAALEGGADAVIGVKRVPNPQAYGVAVVEGGRLIRLVEKPVQPESDLAACGVFAFRPALLDDVAALLPSERGELEFPQAITALIARGGLVRAVEFQGFWSDAGTPADLLVANTHFLTQQTGRVGGRVLSSELRGLIVIEPGASVQDSELTGPLWIGPHASIRGSLLGPNVSVGAHARIHGAAVQDSLVDEFARILHPERPLTRAIIGRHATVTAPGVGELHLVIGDRSVAQQ
ncbi:glucose-1-phosphate thymidylyltransferase [Deinococcus metalli]|uniref:Glucose-1-phosphate thymidylyltransferase n=1 Tax=Deinococcus metalli TaxID=1141878 RepID=A0A7W8NPC8_9DEIO|nr:sugar phosphate nucleotidyltransferase [Deinococcus metalli]MBB5374703.1 glucose-1-phosphate thymidylyltransferase [Deinococcus metalli]GHF34338.1 glucose-1-phosphate thymidylyltransferase [Deinococcus metalli]